MLEVIDDALSSAAEAQKTTSNWQEVDEKVERAIEALSVYEKKYHPKEIVAERMIEAGSRRSNLKLNRPPSHSKLGSPSESFRN